MERFTASMGQHRHTDHQRSWLLQAFRRSRNVIYNADAHSPQFCNGNQWVTLSTGGSDWNKSAPRRTIPAASAEWTAWCWGAGGAGAARQWIDPATQSTPVLVSGGGTWKSIQRRQLGRRRPHLRIKRNGTAWCWGNGSSGQRGDGSTTATQPRRGGLWRRHVESIIAGGRNTCGSRATAPPGAG